MYSDVAGLADVYGKGNVGVIHFDAHYDASKRMFGHLISHGQPVYRLIEEGHVPGKNFIQVGLRGYYPNKESFEWMRQTGVPLSHHGRGRKTRLERCNGGHYQ